MSCLSISCSKSERNPEQKLVVFSESVDTVEYLARRINRKDVLVISADNRSKQFKTIRENFDANYKTKLNDYNIILTTDVLAEGVNLHRANVIVNYDTPWNSTRLMATYWSRQSYRFFIQTYIQLRFLSIPVKETVKSI